MKLKVLDLFSGIGGFSLGLERTGGFETVAFCEIEPYCQKVLRKHWPEVPIYDDVRQLTADRLGRDGIKPDVITGGFPCQDISVAGKGAGIEGERSGLWSELCRIIGEVQPRYAILENVTNLISGDRGRWFGRVLGDLAEIGYDAEWHCIPASAIGAHHHRDRVWIIANPNELGRRQEQVSKSECGDTPELRNDGEKEYVAHPEKLQRNGGEHHRENCNREISELGDCCCQKILADSDSYSGERLKPCILNAERWEIERERQARSCGHGSEWWGFESSVGRVADGIPNRAHRLKGLGNAVVPQIPELIGNAILETQTLRRRMAQGEDEGTEGEGERAFTRMP